MKKNALLVVIIMMMASCGQKGELYLPDAQPILHDTMDDDKGRY